MNDDVRFLLDVRVSDIRIAVRSMEEITPRSHEQTNEVSRLGTALTGEEEDRHPFSKTWQ